MPPEEILFQGTGRAVVAVGRCMEQEERQQVRFLAGGGVDLMRPGDRQMVAEVTEAVGGAGEGLKAVEEVRPAQDRGEAVELE